MKERKIIHEPSVSQTMQALLELDGGKWKVLSVNAMHRRVVLEEVETKQEVEAPVKEEKQAAQPRKTRAKKQEQEKTEDK